MQDQACDGQAAALGRLALARPGTDVYDRWTADSARAAVTRGALYPGLCAAGPRPSGRQARRSTHRPTSRRWPRSAGSSPAGPASPARKNRIAGIKIQLGSSANERNFLSLTSHLLCLGGLEPKRFLPRVHHFHPIVQARVCVLNAHDLWFITLRRAEHDIPQHKPCLEVAETVERGVAGLAPGRSGRARHPALGASPAWVEP
jgi:hypothetical protein